MKYWLFKSEPSTWSWDDQVARGDAGEEWDGVRNYQARNFMRDMAIGDRAFFYHSQSEKAVVGTDDRWECVDIRALIPLKTPVSLADIKARSDLADMALVRSSRLSVQPVTPTEWSIVCRMGGIDP